MTIHTTNELPACSSSLLRSYRYVFSADRRKKIESQSIVEMHRVFSNVICCWWRPIVQTKETIQFLRLLPCRVLASRYSSSRSFLSGWSSRYSNAASNPFLFATSSGGRRINGSVNCENSGWRHDGSNSRSPPALSNRPPPTRRHRQQARLPNHRPHQLISPRAGWISSSPICSFGNSNMPTASEPSRPCWRQPTIGLPQKRRATSSRERGEQLRAASVGWWGDRRATNVAYAWMDTRLGKRW